MIGIEHRIDRAGAGSGRAYGEHRRHRLAEADLLALKIAERRVHPERRQNGIARGLRPVDDQDPDKHKNAHGREDSAPLAHIADDAAESEHGGDGDQQQRPDLQDVGPGVRILERMRRIGVEEAAAVGAEFLDDFLARHRPDRNGLFRSFEGCRVDGAGKRLGHAQSDKDEREDERNRQKNVEADAGHIDPEIADGRGGGADESAHQRESHCETGRRRQEVVHGKAEHLGQMAHRGLAAIVLPVGVGDEADRGVEREIRRDGVEAARIERQQILQPLQGVERQEAGDSEDDHRNRRSRTSPARAPDRPRPDDRTRAPPAPTRGSRKVRSPANTRAINALSGTEQATTRASTSAICDQPTSVIAHSSRSEFFGTDQCVEEVEAEQHRHDQSDDRFAHGALLKFAARPSRRRPSRR